VRQHRRAPARPGASPREIGRQGCEADQQLVAGGAQRVGDVALVREEHVVAAEQLRAVEPDRRQRRQAVEAEHDALARVARERVELGPVPPVARVEIPCRTVERPLAPSAQCGCGRHCAGDREPAIA
jgi:hypothetical protein